MVNSRLDQIGIREYVSLCILVIGLKLSDMTGTLLYDEAENAAWIVVLISGLLSVIPIWFTIRTLRKFPNKTLLEVIETLFGKYVSKLFFILMFCISFSASAIDTRSYADVISTMYFQKTPLLAVYLLIVVISSYVAKKGLEQVGSLAYMMVFYIKFALGFSFVLMFFQGEPARIKPLLGPGEGTILKVAVQKVSIFFDFFFIAILAPFVNTFKNFQKGTWLSLLFITIEISFALFLYATVFDYPSIQKLSYPFHEAIRYIHIADIFTNIETLFFPFWLIATFVRFSVYLYISAMLFSKILNITEFEYIIWPLALGALLLGMIPSNSADTLFIYRNNLLNFGSIAFFLLPFIIWITSKVKGASSHEGS